MLQHEQTHFNIYEYCRRLLIQKLYTAELKKAPVYNQVSIMNYGIEMLLAKINNEYDEQTQFSTNKSKQRRWDKDIISKLEQLKTFNQTELKFHLTD